MTTSDKLYGATQRHDNQRSNRRAIEIQYTQIVSVSALGKRAYRSSELSCK